MIMANLENVHAKSICSDYGSGSFNDSIEYENIKRLISNYNSIKIILEIRMTCSQLSDFGKLFFFHGRIIFYVKIFIV